MKKLIAILMTLALLIGTAALAEGADYLGTWYLNGMLIGEATVAPASMGVEMVLEILADGTATLAMTGEDGGEQAATWALDGDTLTVSVGGEDMTLKLQDGDLVGDQGGMGMVFGREKVEGEVYQPAEVAANAAEADYAGQWRSTYMEIEGTYMDASLLGMDLTAAIDGANITLDGMYVFSNVTFESAFTDGALVHEGGDDEMYAGITAQLLADGAMRLTFDTGDEPLILIMEKAA